MKILFIVNNLHTTGGTERVVCNLANLLSDKLNYNITIANRETERERVFFSLNDNVDIMALGKNYLSFYVNLNKLIKQLNPEIVLVHNMGKLSILAAFLQIPKNTRLFSLEHGNFQSRPSWLRTLSKVVYKKYHKIITLTKNEQIDYSHFHQDVITIPNISAYDVTTLDNVYSSNSKTVIAIGRLVHEKNFLALLNAWKGVQEKHGDWQLNIYGEGEERQLLKEYIRNNKLTSISLKGNQSNLSEVYKNASFVVMSSRNEGLPLVLIEAQSFGLPLISFDCPYGPREIIKNGHNGYLVEDQNIAMLESKILDLIKNKEMRNLFSKNAKADALRYCSTTILDHWNSLFNSYQ